MMTMKISFALLLVAAAFNGFSEGANLRHVQRKLSGTYSQSSDMLSEMLARVNKERASQNLPPVCANKKLQSSSQRHSDDMAENNYMAHDGTDGSTMSQRITDAGYKWSAVGENVAAGQVDVQAVMDAWMNSPEHRENIMGEYTMLGVSYAFNENTEYKHYWTQDFGKGDTESCDSNPNAGSENQEQGDQKPDQEQVAQNEDQVLGEADPEATPVPKTSVFVTKTPETPCPENEKNDTPVQEASPSPESQRSTEDNETPGKVTAPKDCNPKF
ncbi:SCP-like extracellular protein [Phytophthora palmivora]|uniref:SCP-like extracellular protein n=1 Tax=Phytophthora palmivora TaxID=4796 RepID=A0A2P4WWJ3_9STRA|nr:SCP-like extracellular protein [Phytophthora palmivora]